MTHGPPEPHRYGISRTRRALVQLGIVGLLAASAYEIPVHGEHWPFSSYAMFSSTRREARVLHHALVAIPRDGSGAFPLYEPAQIHPYLWYRHQKAFKLMLEGAGGEPAVREGLADALVRYELARREGRHDGPPLRALRLYRVDYAIDPHAPDLLRHDERTLVAEVTAGESAEALSGEQAGEVRAGGGGRTGDR